MKTINPQNAKFVAKVRGVRELRLIGNANLDFWNAQLTDKPFQAFAFGDFAEITIAATELIWKGFRFNELTVALTLAAKNNRFDQIGYLLLHALNSNRLFAFCERTFFSTPYSYGQIRVRETMPCSINAESGNESVFSAEMNGVGRSEIEESEFWEGAVFLPDANGNKYFIGKLSGNLKICPFVTTDRVELRTDAKIPVFGLLANSGFAGKEWRMRSAGFHAKSKTYNF